MYSRNALLLVVVLAGSCFSAGTALKCFMCNSLMENPPMVGACADASSYMSMDCKDVTLCLKLDGVYKQQVNESSEITITGPQRDCGSVGEVGLYFNSTKPAANCYDVDVSDVPLTTQAFPKMAFKGKVCLCDTNECNNARGLKFGLAALVFSVATVLFKWF